MRTRWRGYSSLKKVRLAVVGGERLDQVLGRFRPAHHELARGHLDQLHADRIGDFGPGRLFRLAGARRRRDAESEQEANRKGQFGSLGD